MNCRLLLSIQDRPQNLLELQIKCIDRKWGSLFLFTSKYPNNRATKKKKNFIFNKSNMGLDKNTVELCGAAIQGYLIFGTLKIEAIQGSRLYIPYSHISNYAMPPSTVSWQRNKRNALLYRDDDYIKPRREGRGRRRPSWSADLRANANRPRKQTLSIHTDSKWAIPCTGTACDGYNAAEWESFLIPLHYYSHLKLIIIWKKPVMNAD